MRDFTQEKAILSAKAADGVGDSLLVEDFKHIVLSLNTASSANLTVKFAGSIQETAPDLVLRNQLLTVGTISRSRILRTVLRLTGIRELPYPVLMTTVCLRLMLMA